MLTMVESSEEVTKFMSMEGGVENLERGTQRIPDVQLGSGLLPGKCGRKSLGEEQVLHLFYKTSILFFTSFSRAFSFYVF